MLTNAFVFDNCELEFRLTTVSGTVWGCLRGPLPDLLAIWMTVREFFSFLAPFEVAMRFELSMYDSSGVLKIAGFGCCNSGVNIMYDYGC